MKRMKCKHKWKVDQRFEDGSIIMLFGPVNKLRMEKRYVCEKCGEIDYRATKRMLSLWTKGCSTKPNLEPIRTKPD